MQSIILTIDVEDYYHATSCERVVPRTKWDGMESRVVSNTQKVLDILKDGGVTGTFFVLGWVAEKYPALVRSISEAGHEVASHGYDHTLVYKQTPKEFRFDVRKSKEILERVLSGPVIGYRAPTFSITRNTPWAHRILAEEGYAYSSSVFPVRHDRYGWPEFGGDSRNLRFGKEIGIWEFPLPFFQFGKILIPFGGGGYLRIYPFWLTKKLLRNGIMSEGKTTVLYFHPWEIDPLQPRLPLDALSKLRHYWGVGSTEKKILKIVQTFPTETITSQLSFRQTPCGGERSCAG